MFELIFPSCTTPKFTREDPLTHVFSPKCFVIMILRGVLALLPRIPREKTYYKRKNRHEWGQGGACYLAVSLKTIKVSRRRRNGTTVYKERHWRTLASLCAPLNSLISSHAIQSHRSPCQCRSRLRLTGKLLITPSLCVSIQQSL